MKTLFIMQGVPGSGKSTMAKKMVRESSRPTVIVSADYYFLDENDNYVFNPEKLGEAHDSCLQSAKHWMDDGWDVIVDNTNIQRWQATPYIDYAKNLGYSVRVIRCEGNFKNIHGVPEEKVEKMRKAMENL